MFDFEKRAAGLWDALLTGIDAFASTADARTSKVTWITEALREAYEQGRKDENEACAEVVEEGPEELLDDGSVLGRYCGCTKRLARYVRQRGPNAHEAKEGK